MYAATAQWPRNTRYQADAIPWFTAGDAINDQRIDARIAVQLAKAMIGDGCMPTPEDALSNFASWLAAKVNCTQPTWPLPPICGGLRGPISLSECDR